MTDPDIAAVREGFDCPYADAVDPALHSGCRWCAEMEPRLAALARVEARLEAAATREWATRRMLQALDAYWLGYEGLPNGRYPRGKYDGEDWWTRYEKYRALAGKDAG